LNFPGFFRQKTHKKITEPKGLPAIERLEKQSWQLSLLTIVVICALAVFIVITHLEKLSGSPWDWWKNSDFFNLNVLASAALIFLFCVYLFWKNLVLRRQRRAFFTERIPSERIAGPEQAAPFSQITAAMTAQKDLPVILELIARESLSALNGHRSTIFLTNGETGALKTHSVCCNDPAHEQVSLLEEKEIARKALKIKKPLLLAGPEDFADFPNYAERPKKITSLVTIPLAAQGKGIGALSLALMNGQRSFCERDLQVLTVFANHAAIAVMGSELIDQARKASETRLHSERSLDDLFRDLESRSPDELRRVRDRMAGFFSGAAAAGNGNGAKTKDRDSGGGAAVEQTETVKFEIEEQDLAQTEDLSSAGLFIRTSNPLELGEQFLLRLHLPLGGGPVEVSCKVIWTNKYGKESKHLHRGMGVKFINLAGEAKKRIEDFIILEKDTISSASKQESNPISGNGKNAVEGNGLHLS
jgi:Tfp pilus assembly protein PilZ